MKKKWDELSLEEQAEIMKVAVRNGIYDLYKIRDKYNEFAEGGSKGEEEEVNTIVPFTQKTEVVITPNTEYNQYLNTLPDNQRFTPNDAYDSYLYWKLNDKPRNFREAYDKGMFTWDSSDNGYHANSIAFGDDGVGYFMKPKTHDTVGYETDWYNKGLVTEEGGTQRPMTPEERAEWLDFRNQYNLVDDPDRPNYYRYEPKSKHSLGGPLVEAAMNEYRHGGGIHIKPENRGKFTRLKERTGHSASWFKEHGTPAQKKMAVFELNARKWKHGLGGNLFGGTSQPTQKMQIGLDVQGWPDYTTEQIVAYGNENERRRKAIQDAYLNFVIESNDATAVANGRPQNQHLVDKTVRGAKVNATWEKEHPNLTAWSYLPSTAVIGTALAPLGAAGWSGLTALGDAAAATSTGQAITAGLTPLATAASTSVAKAPLYTWADVGLSSLFGGHGVQTAIDEGGVSPMTALEIAPLGRLAKPYKNMLQNTWEEGKLENILGAIEDIDPNTKKAATQKLMDFINSEDYHNRLKAAGLDKYWDEIGSLIESRIDAENLFPGKVATNLIQEREALGSSHPTKGIFVQAGIPEEELLSIIDHELAHYSTMGLGKNDMINIIYSKILGMPSNKVISKMMKYNDRLASTNNYNDFRKAFFEIQGIDTPSIKDNISALQRYMYFNSSQEKRARAYATLQEALKKGQSTDEFVDSYTYDDKIIASAPEDLMGLGLIMRPKEIKKYLKGFLSVSSPAAVSTLLDNKKE